jgi:hypothetical protein
MRFAARTSSGTATRNSSIRPRAAFWSTTTFVVSGSFLPLAISDSRRSTRKMMSIGVSSGSVGSVGADYRTGCVRLGGACREPWTRAPVRRKVSADVDFEILARSRNYLVQQAGDDCT